MSINRNPMTAHGAELLRNELENLKRVERPRIIEAIAEARAHGDLKENAEYHEARREQSLIEGRIVEVESKLGSAQIINPAELPASSRIVFGATVELINLSSEESSTYQIVGEDEADIKKGKISVRSPIARAIIGKELDDVVELQAPGGIVEYEISDVKYI